MILPIYETSFCMGQLSFQYSHFGDKFIILKIIDRKIFNFILQTRRDQNEYRKSFLDICQRKKRSPNHLQKVVLIWFEKKTNRFDYTFRSKMKIIFFDFHIRWLIRKLIWSIIASNFWYFNLFGRLKWHTCFLQEHKILHPIMDKNVKCDNSIFHQKHKINMDQLIKHLIEFVDQCVHCVFILNEF